MTHRSPQRGRNRHPSLGPVLLLSCGALVLYLVSVSHFVVSCLDQIRQAVETTRHAYLPDAVRQQQDAANAERLHRFAAVVRYATDGEARRQAALHVQTMVLNASPSRATDTRVRWRLGARLVKDLARLRQRQDELADMWQGQAIRLCLLREKLGEGADPGGLRARVDRLLADPLPGSVRPVSNAALPKDASEVTRWLKEMEDTRQEARLVAADVRATWERCDGVLTALADSIGADACLRLDGLIADLAQQVHGLQRLAAWLMVLTFGVLLAVSVFLYRRVVRPVLAYARAVCSGDRSQLPENPHFRELHEIGEALRRDDAKPTASPTTDEGET